MRSRTNATTSSRVRRQATGDFGNRKWRHAEDGGFFRYVLKVLPHQPQELSVTYWGSERGRRSFDILIDGKKLATERLRTTGPSSSSTRSTRFPKT